MIFTVEEMSIIDNVKHDNREMALAEIISDLPLIQDKELKSLCEHTAKKLKSMKNDEFDKMNFTVEEG